MKTFAAALVRFTLLSIAVVCAIVPARVRAALPGDLALPFVTTDTTAVRDPYPILTPLAGGPLRVLFVGDGRTVAPVAAGVAARIDCTAEVVLTSSRTVMGVPDGRGNGVPAPLLESSVRRRIESSLRDAWDVIWLDADLDSIPGGLRETILAKVDGGTGLVMAGDRDQARDIAGKPRTEARLSEPFGYKGLDEPEVLTRGHGTVVSLPEPPPVDAPLTRGNFDNLAAFALVYASGNLMPMTVRDIQVADKPVEQEAIGIMKYRVRLYNNAGETDSVTVMVRCRDGHGMTVQASTLVFLPDEEEHLLSIAYPVVPVGAYALDITGVTEKGVVFFGGATFSVAATEHIERLTLWRPAAHRGEFIMGTVGATTPFREGTYVTIDIRDTAGRLLDRKLPDIVTGRKSTDFIMRVREQYPGVVVVAAAYYKNDSLVEEVTRLFFVTEDRMFAFAFGVSGAGGPPLAPEQYRDLADAGVGLYAGPVAVSDDPGDVFEQFAAPAAVGLPVVPDLTHHVNTSDRTVRAMLDTLAALDPAAVKVTGDEQAHLVRTEMPGRVIIYQPGTELSRGTDVFVPDSLTVVADTVPEPVMPAGRSPLQTEAAARALLVPDDWAYPGDERMLGAIPWWAFLAGYRQIWWDSAPEEFAAITPWGTLSPSCRIVARETDRIGSGIDLLVDGAGANAGDASPVGLRVTDDRGEPVSDASVLTRVWYDGRMAYAGIAFDPAADTEPPPFLNIRFEHAGTPSYLYNSMEGTALGAVSSLSDSLSHGALMVALLPYRVQSLDIALAKPIAEPDTPAEFTARVLPAGGESPGRHVFVVELIQPGNEDRSIASMMVEAPDGRYEGTIRIPRDAVGTCLLKVTDVASGRANERPVIVREAQQ